MRPLVRRKALLFVPVVVLLSASVALAGWADALNKVKSAVESQSATTGASSLGEGLSTADITSGLKAALEKAARTAVSSLGVTDGFLGNAEVKIPVPGAVSKIETGLRLIGQTELADAFVTSMNRAAENAVPETLDVLGAAVSRMSIDDAKGILNGGETAATDYFRKTADGALVEKIAPLVQTAMAQVDVTGSYQRMVQAASAAGVETSDYDLDAYVTRKALDGLYLMMEKQEAEIRRDPVARTSEILRKVFGAQ